MRLLLSSDDRIRPDGTCVLFRRAFEEVLGKENVIWKYPEELAHVTEPFDLLGKIDDGLSQNRWNPRLHPSFWYVIDCHVDLDWRLDLEREGNFDFLFFAQKEPLEAGWACQKRFWVPLAADPELHYTGPKEKKYDVCFIGNFHSRHSGKRIELCDRLFREFPNFYYGHVCFKDMAEKFAQSKLVWNWGLNKDTNMRFFEAMMSGSALLSNYLPAQDELGFVAGRDYIAYTDEKDMIEKARYYLEHDEEREKIAKSGHALVKSLHTYRHRAQEILYQFRKIQAVSGVLAGQGG